MNAEQQRFIGMVVEVVKADPEMGPKITDACSLGIGLRFREEAEKSCDLECALVAICTDRQNDWARQTLLQKIEKWNGRLSLRWDWFIEKMTKRKVA